MSEILSLRSKARTIALNLQMMKMSTILFGVLPVN